MTHADLIYTHGDIVTVDDSKPAAEAVAVGGGKILAVGSAQEMAQWQGPSTKVIDLGGKTMVPGFLDAHSHFMNALQVLSWANVSVPPVGPVKSIPDILAVLKDHKERFQPAPGEWVLGYGYDGNELAEGREVTRHDLDPLFPDNPVMLIHVSNHGAVCNSAAFKIIGFSASTPTPPNSVIVRDPATQEPAGLIMEMAFFPFFARLPKPGEAEMLERLHEAQMIYARAGVTTAQEGATSAPDLALLQKGASQGRLFLDVSSHVAITELKEVLQHNPPSTFNTYHNHLKLGGVKCVFDGSPQGRTAFFSKPYLTDGPSGEKNWRGEPSFPPETLFQMVKNVYDHGLWLNVHCNGDGAIDLMLEAHERAAANDLAADRRTTCIHSQFVRQDQLEKYVKYGIVASFFPSHTYFFSHIHKRYLGLERTEFFNPLKTALDMGIHCTAHTDFSITPIDQIFILWAEVNRLDRQGKVTGPDQRITPLQALRTITIDVAYQYHEEASKGSITPGKLADLVILSANPLKVDPVTIKDIAVLETIKEGKTIYSAASVPVA